MSREAIFWSRFWRLVVWRFLKPESFKKEIEKSTIIHELFIKFNSIIYSIQFNIKDKDNKDE